MDKVGPDQFEFRLEGQNINETADVNVSGEMCRFVAETFDN